jgi:ABC-2 type transport system ATP-binding protein
VTPAITVENVSKRFRMYNERNQSLKAAVLRGRRASYDEFWALRDVSFEIPEGSTFALMGENGSGKSTLLKCLARILVPNDGKVRTRGSVAALLELGSGFHPELTGRENVFLNGSILGLSKKEIERKLDGIIDFAGIDQFIDQPVKNYSSGMYVRLGFSVAINVDPDILLVDEVLAVGDAAFQAKCMDKFAEFRRAGKTVVVVSHSMGALRTMCDEAAWLDHGELVKTGTAADLVDDYNFTTLPAHTNAGEVELDEPGSRLGSGEAVIERVEVVDDHDDPVTTVRTGDAITVRLHYRSTERIEKPVFGLALENLDGVYVWACHTRDVGHETAWIDGAGTIECRIPKLLLQPGSFDLIASVVDWTTTHQYDYLRHCYRFDVAVGTPRNSGGIAALEVQWSGSGDTPEDATSHNEPASTGFLV